MGYETDLVLVGVRPPPGRLARVKRALKRMQREQASEAAYIFRHPAFSSDGTIEFNSVSFDDPDALLAAAEEPDEEGLVLTALADYTPQIGKWYDVHLVAAWLCEQGCEGRIIQHSRDGDGEAWGWEFADGRIRELQLLPASGWVRLGPKRRQSSSSARRNRPASED
jgi:hypothetical protein